MNNYTLRTTPWYINNVHSPFWSALAKEEAHKNGEYCKHSRNFMNLRVFCTKTNKNYINVEVICSVCKKIFDHTARELHNNYLVDYGF
jgi:hypothetical protein